MTNTIVDVRDLRKVYGGWMWGKRRQVNAVRGVSLQASAGEVFGLLGPNGAGKTTLIKMLLGVVKPSGGSATLFDLPVGSSQARRRVGYLPESLRVDRHHTARTALKYYGRMSRMTSSEIQRRSDELLELVGLDGRDKESVKRFSKGMYQRLGLAQALMHDPDLLVLDEPTDGLDPVGRNEVRWVINRLRESGKTIFLNSHILQEVELVCSRVAILAAGKIRAMGRLDELADREQTQVTLCIHGDGLDSDSVAKLVHECLPLGSDASKTVGFHHGDNADEAPELFEAIENGWRLLLPIHLQDQIDRVVDRVRGSGYSISQLLVKPPTLEDTFIRLVGQAEQSDSEESNELPDARDQSSAQEAS